MTVGKFLDYLKNSKNDRGKFSESSDFSVIGGLPDFTIVLCIQYIPINGKVESKLNFLYTIYRVKKENKILYIVVRARKKKT